MITKEGSGAPRPYVAWKSGADKKIVIANLNTGGLIISDDWSDYTPAIAVFQGQLFVAWRGGGCQNESLLRQSSESAGS
jgi:hypothetical protein